MLWRHQLFFDHVVSNLHIRHKAVRLPISSLKHVELLLLDREFEVLHVAEVLLECLTNFDKFLVSWTDDLSLAISEILSGVRTPATTSSP